MQKQHQDFLAVFSAIIVGIGYIGFKVANLAPHDPLFVAKTGTATLIVMVVSSILMTKMAPDPNSFKD